jgi:LemA protein
MIYIVAVVVIALFVVAYNQLVRLRNRTANAWSQVDVQLKSRYDLIPNLVETVKGYAAHEQDTLDNVIQARNRVHAASGPAEQAAADNLLTGALRQLFALSEAYPDLKASEQFGQLQSKLSEAENKIAISRQIYNDTVLTYNNKVETIPSNIVAGMTGFKIKEYFETDAAADDAPNISF